MKIVCIATSQVPSSTANSIQVMKACQALAQLGHSVQLLVPGRGGSVWEGLAGHYGLQEHFNVQWLPTRDRLRRYDFSLAAVRRARRLGADLLYIWPLQAAVFALLQDRPVLLELHGEPEGRFGPWLFRLFLRIRPTANYGVSGNKRLLPITHALAAYLERTYRYQFDSAEMVVSPNGVDLDRYHDLPGPEGARSRLGLPANLTVGITGHLYVGRGMGLLEELARLFPQVNFLWVGGRQEDVESWRERFAWGGVKNVTLTGFVENRSLPLYQAAAEVLLMPYERRITGSSGGNSVDYCSPMKMFEYMACGRAIVSSDLPVIREVLNEGNAVLCAPEEVDAWAQALRALIADPVRRIALGEAAKRDVQSYTWIGRARRALEGFVAE